jgi:hypothetical protein
MNKMASEINYLNHPLLPYIELLALYIRINTSECIEISYLIDDDGILFFQIDEYNNKFYFTFFSDRIEFAFGNFDVYVSMTWKTLFSSDNMQLLSKLQSLGTSDPLIESFRLFLFFLKNLKKNSTETDLSFFF